MEGCPTKPPQFFKKALIAKNTFFFFRISSEECSRPFFFSIPPVVSDSFITSQRRAAPDKGISTPRSPLRWKRVPQLKGGRSLAAGPQHGAVIKGSRAAADPRSPKSAPPKRKEAQRELGWAGVGRRGYEMLLTRRRVPAEVIRLCAGQTSRFDGGL